MPAISLVPWPASEIVSTMAGLVVVPDGQTRDYSSKKQHQITGIANIVSSITFEALSGNIAIVWSSLEICDLSITITQQHTL